MEMDGDEAKSQFGGSNKRARTTAASQWDSQVFSDDAAEADVRTKLGAATLSGATRKAGTAGGLTCVLFSFSLSRELPTTLVSVPASAQSWLH